MKWTFRDWSLSAKLVAVVVATSTLPLAATAWLTSLQSREQADADGTALLQARADQVAADLDGLHRQYSRSSFRVAHYGFVVRAAREDGPHRKEVATFLEAFANADPAVYAVTLFDPSGLIVATSLPPFMGRRVTDRRYLSEALAGRAYVSDPFVSPLVDPPVSMVAYAQPVSVDQRIVGVLAVFVKTDALEQIVRAANGRVGPLSDAVLYDSVGVRIVHGTRPDYAGHPAGRLEPAQEQQAVREKRFGPDTAHKLATVRPAPDELARVRRADLPPVFRASGEDGRWLVVTRRLAHAPWTLFYRMPEELLEAPGRRLLGTITATAGVAMALALLAGLLLARMAVGPLAVLARTAQAYAAGDLRSRARLGQRDEIGQLGDHFDAMAEALSLSRQGLEEQVQERTQALARANEELTVQNRELADQQAAIEHRSRRDVAYAEVLRRLQGDEGRADPADGEGSGLREGLRAAVDHLGAALAIVYRLEGSRLVPLASVAAGADAEVKPVPVQGWTREALERGRPMVLDPVPADAVWSWDAGLVHGQARAVVLVPLQVGGRPQGILATGLLRAPDPQTQAFLTDLAVPLGLAVARLTLAEQANRYVEELRARNDELLAQQHEIEEKSREVGEANLAKSNFLANMSHELRTPLNAVIGFSELLLDRAEGRLEPRETVWVQDILASGRHLLALINDILDLSKIEAGRLDVAQVDLTPADVVQEVTGLMRAAAVRKHIELRTAATATRQVRADPDRVRQILLNLLSNAVKFSPDGGVVEVRALDDGDAVRFEVQDHGPGISEALRERLFQPFVQGEAPHVKRHEGTGLGLAISKRLAELQGGSVGVASKEGQGATFWVRLPVVVAPERPRLPTGRMPALKTTGSPPRGEPTPPVALTPAVKPGTRLLSIDDDPAVGQILTSMLQPHGFSVHCAHTAQEGLRLAEEVRPHLVVVDLTLPDLDGMAVIERLTSAPDGKRLPIVALTSRDLDEVDRRRLRQARVTLARKGDLTLPELLLALTRPLTPPVGLPVVRGVTVLVVDDNDTNRELSRTLLERMGHRVVEARDGAEALDVARQVKPDLVLMDLAMPVMDGYQATRELKADPDTRSIPVIALTALAMRGDEERARAAGCDGYVSKPIDPKLLRQAVQAVLG